MYSGISSFSRRTGWVLRVAALVIPVLLVLYGLAVRGNFVDSSHYAGDTPFTILMVLWGILAIKQYFVPPTRTAVEVFQLALYHLFAGAYITLVSGFETAFVIAWVLLIFTSYAYYRVVGLVMSVVTLLVVGIVDLLLHATTIQFVVTDALSVLATITVGSALAAIGRTQEIDSLELSKAKTLETLQRDRIITLINNLADAVLSTDKDGVIKIYNAASLNLLNTNESLNGQKIEDVLPLHDSTGRGVSFFKELKKTHSVTVRDDLEITQDGDTVRLEVTYSPIRSSYSQSKKSEPQDGYIIILRDVTKAKSLEEERDEFISVVSHELRTPLTIAEGAISNAQIMLDRPDTSKDIVTQSMATAHDQMLFLAKMVNDLSTLSRAERGVADTPEEIDIKSLVGDLYTESGPQAEKKGLRFDLDLSPHLGTVYTSPLYLKELLQNFVTNSLKYTKEGSITLRVHRAGDKVTFDVKDTGIGISKSDQAKVFNKFYRSEDYRTRETGGTGLGLYVAAKLARKIGTKITLVSRLNHGSSFSFILNTVKKDTPKKPASETLAIKTSN
jgi:PAS domain S-box-containing protein